jgi:hypothetical protein
LQDRKLVEESATKTRGQKRGMMVEIVREGSSKSKIRKKKIKSRNEEGGRKQATIFTSGSIHQQKRTSFIIGWLLSLAGCQFRQAITHRRFRTHARLSSKGSVQGLARVVVPRSASRRARIP